MTSDQILPDIPSSIVSFYTNNLEPRVPVVAVACGSDLLIYKNNKPFYKFSVPSSRIEPIEEDAWRRMEESDCNFSQIIANLKTVPYNLLSRRSQELLNVQAHKIEEYVGRYVGTPLVKSSPITCMATLNRTTQEKLAVACPIVGTECGNIYILDPQTFTILHQSNASSAKATPSIIKTAGIYDVDFRIVVACRENVVCELKRGWLEGKTLIQLADDIVDMVIIPGDMFIVVATATKTMHCYTKRGQRIWSTSVNNHITCLQLVPLKHLSTHLVAVGMKGGSIHLYHGRHPVDYTNAPDTPSALVFGQLGQEEHVLIIITLAGTINFRILKRTADFNLSSQDRLTSPTLQSKPLPLPKRSKLFLEQSMRERQNAVDMHRIFQQDLVKLRLITARALVQSLSDQSGTGNEQEQVKLSAQVLGLGPKFTLILTLENMHTENSVFDFTIVFHTNPAVYALSSYVNPVPLIPPGLSYKMKIQVNELIKINSETNQPQVVNLTGQIIRVFVLRNRQAQPVIAATINMPPTELFIDV